MIVPTVLNEYYQIIAGPGRFWHQNQSNIAGLSEKSLSASDEKPWLVEHLCYPIGKEVG
jgi:hypothetical protein